MKIQNVNDESFKKYGKVLNGYHVAGILKEMEHTPLTKEVVYVPSVEEMEALPDAEEMKKKLSAIDYHYDADRNQFV